MDELLDGILSRVSLLRQENAQLKQDLEIHETNIASLETQVTDLYPVRRLTDNLSSLLNSLQEIAVLRREHAAMKAAMLALMRQGGVSDRWSVPTTGVRVLILSDSIGNLLQRLHIGEPFQTSP